MMMETTNAFTDDDDDDDAADASSSSSSASSSSSSSTLNSWIDLHLGRKSIERPIDLSEGDLRTNRQDPPATPRIGDGVVSNTHECASRREHKGKAEGEECTPTDAFRRFNYRILEVESE